MRYVEVHSQLLSLPYNKLAFIVKEGVLYPLFLCPKLFFKIKCKIFLLYIKYFLYLHCKTITIIKKNNYERN